MVWNHGTYELLSNGSIILTPFGDGFQQVQDPCGAVSNFIQSYNETELFQSWRIFMDPDAGPKLHLFKFDGSPESPQFLVSKTPNMLPTQLLRNVTTATAATKRDLLKRSAGERSWTPAGMVALVVSLGTACAASLIL